MSDPSPRQAGLAAITNALASATRVVPRRLLRGPLRPQWSWQLEIVVHLMRRSARRISALPPPDQGRAWEAATPPSPVTRRFRFDPVSAGAVAAEWVIDRELTEEARTRAPLVVHLHGGWYSSCSPRNFRVFLARLALASGARVLSIDYRLAPEHRFPAPVEDAVAAYRWVLAQGERSSRIVVVGESAGGGLAAALLLRLRDAGIELPAGAALLSPWADLTARGGSLVANAAFDWYEPEEVPHRARLYLGDHDPADPLASPALADLHGLPPLFVQAGTAEMLFDQGVRLAERARQSGVSVTFDVLEGMIHNTHLFATFSPMAMQAIVHLATFIRERTA